MSAPRKNGPPVLRRELDVDGGIKDIPLEDLEAFRQDQTRRLLGSDHAILQRIAKERLLRDAQDRDAARVAKANRAVGTVNSVDARRERTVDRDRRIHDAHVAGKAPKKIAGDRKIVGRKLSFSQVRRILAKPRP